MTPEVSVCIPTYEQPELTYNAVRSALDQKKCNLEIVISDDSRTNAVRAAITPLLQDGRVKYCVNKYRLGAVRNWNKAISLASGKYINLLHHDDKYSHEYSLSLFLNRIEKSRYDVAFSGYRDRRGDEITSIKVLDKETIHRIRNDVTILFEGNVIGDPSTCMFSSRIKERFDRNLMWLSDVDFYCRAVRFSGSFEYIDEPLVDVSRDGHWQISRAFDNNPEGIVFEYAIVANKFRNEIAVERKEAIHSTLKHHMRIIGRGGVRAVFWKLMRSRCPMAAMYLLNLNREL